MLSENGLQTTYGITAFIEFKTCKMVKCNALICTYVIIKKWQHCREITEIWNNQIRVNVVQNGLES